MTTSLPDLYSTTQSFGGVGVKSEFSTKQSLRPGADKFERPKGRAAKGDKPAGSGPLRQEVPGLFQVLTTYSRIRNAITDAQGDKQRVPKMHATRLHQLEHEAATGLRGLNPGLFQRFSDAQVLRLIRTVPICKYAEGSWIFTRHPKEEANPPPPEYYLVAHGQVDFYERSPHIGGDPIRLLPGQLFAEGGFARQGGSVEYRGSGAQAMDTVVVIVLSREAAGACCHGDRLVADAKYANVLSRLSVFAEIPVSRLNNWLSVAQIYRIPAGHELLSWEALEDFFLVVVKGTMNWCADVTLREIEEVEKQTSRRKMNVFIEAAIGLRGGSLFDKLDPYCVCRLSPQKQFQTKTMMNAGREPYFNHNGTLVYDGEEGIEFTVYDWNEHGTHDVLGTGFIPARDFQGRHGFEGEVKLTKPQQHSLWGGPLKSKKGADDGGVLLVMVQWGEVLGFRSVTKHKEPRCRTWKQVPLLDLAVGPGAPGTQVPAIFGHEQILLGDAFFENLYRSTTSLGYSVKLEDFRIMADSSGTQLTEALCLRIPRANLEAFLQRSGKFRDMLTHALNSTNEKQLKLRDVCYQLILKWSEEDRRREQQKSMSGGAKKAIESLDVGKIRQMLRGALLTVNLVSALGLGGGRHMDKLDPYLLVKLAGSNQHAKSPIYDDAGQNPSFDFECRFWYNGETVLEITIMDRDPYAKDTVIGVTSLSIEQFHDGFVGALPVKRPATASKKAGPAGTLNLSIEWSKIPEQ